MKLQLLSQNQILSALEVNLDIKSIEYKVAKLKSDLAFC